MLSPNMQDIATKLEAYYRTCFPEAYLTDMFEDARFSKISLRELVLQVMVEGCKFAFDYSSPKRTLRQHMLRTGKNWEEDGLRKLVSRELEKVHDFRSREYAVTKERYGIEVPEFLPPSMDDIKEKLSGHQLTDFQFWEITNVHDMRLPTAIADKRICKKNFTKNDFQEYSAEYDAECTHFQELFADGNIVIPSLSYFTLEWKYSFDFTYALATRMEELDIETLEPARLRAVAYLCCSIPLFTILYAIRPDDMPTIPIGQPTDSRFITFRNRYIDTILTLDIGQLEDFLKYISEMIAMLRMPLIDLDINNWFLHNSTEEDWNTVFEEYNALGAFVHPKTWSKKSIRNAKMIYDLTRGKY